MASDAPSSTIQRVHVWDLATRVFHWLLVGLVVFLFISGKTGGNLMLWHSRAGALVLVLLVFRVVWGVIGSSTARFRAFVVGPKQAWVFARQLLGISTRHTVTPAEGAATTVMGHNPLGGWMVVVLLLLLTIQVSTGLFANDDIAMVGPWAVHISKALSDRLTTVHRWNQWILLGCIAIHLLGVAFHVFIKKENLISAMISGVRKIDGSVQVSVLRLVSTWIALLVFVLAFVVVGFVVQPIF